VGVGLQIINNKVVFQSNMFYTYSTTQGTFVEEDTTTTLLSSSKIKKLTEKIVMFWYFYDESMGTLIKVGNNKYKHVITPFQV
jgi:hypothetical protein